MVQGHDTEDVIYSHNMLKCRMQLTWCNALHAVGAAFGLMLVVALRNSQLKHAGSQFR